ncbi:hypothetical protein ERO13_A02G026101v2 [Gossypium hirsutum]|nr:hypothetical protein ERO13_A02G026101v2 [Gossypium hirsutum]
MLGRLDSILAKELLNGQKVVVVRCEEICMWGGLVRQKMKHMRFLRKRMNTFAGLKLKAYEGIPGPYDKTKRMVIRDALMFCGSWFLSWNLEFGFRTCFSG